MLYLSCQEILFFNHVQTEKRKASQRFPSPVGESYFSIMVNFYMMVYEHSFHPLSGNLIFQSIECDCNGFQLGFRPLSGNLIFQWNTYTTVTSILVSVPCRGILFFNDIFTPSAMAMASSFRPLSGNLIFQFVIYPFFEPVITFPSPVGESYFSMK